MMGIIPEDANAVTIAALLALSIARDEANLPIDLTMEHIFSERRFFVYSVNEEDSELFFLPFS
jgi:hypothetical protein